MAIGLCLSGCSTPNWHADTAPADTALFVDGHRRTRSTLDERIPYYGVVELAAIPRFETATREIEPLSTARTKLLIDEPVSPWLFPFDFVLEIARAPFVDDPIPTAHLTAPPRTDVAIPRAQTPGTEAFLARARSAAARR